MITKGQAVMEFLLTYGWVLVVLVFAFSALVYSLVYFGVLSPDMYMFRPSCYCSEFDLDHETDFTLESGKYFVCSETDYIELRREDFPLIEKESTIYLFNCTNHTLELIDFIEYRKYLLI